MLEDVLSVEGESFHRRIRKAKTEMDKLMSVPPWTPYYSTLNCHLAKGKK